MAVVCHKIVGRILVLSVLTASAQASPAKLWLDSSLPPETRAQHLLDSMTTAEKILLLSGHRSEDKTCGDYIGRVGANNCSVAMNHSIPTLLLNDAGQGFREENNSMPGSTTQWPSALAMAATWSTEAATEWGVAMGAEFKGKGANVQLGPGLCVSRIPNNGRTFEYLSGEDPVLGAELIGPLVKGIQSQGVIAVGKHWVNNQQETNRTRNDAIVDEQTRFELYYPPFEAAVRAGIGAIMCSYNLINSEWSCQNNDTLHTDLKHRLGFTGWVMSDWGACHSASINQGLDQEMPASVFFNSGTSSKTHVTLGNMLANGSLSLARLDDATLRVLRPMFRVGLFDEPLAPSGVPAKPASNRANVTSAAHTELCRSLAARGIVLLKNERQALPISASPTTTIAVIGAQAWSRDAAGHRPIVGGEGSGSVKPAHVVDPLTGLLARLGGSHPGDNVTCSPAHGAPPRSPCSWTIRAPALRASALRASALRAPALRASAQCGSPNLSGFDINGHDLVEPPKKVSKGDKGVSECCTLCANWVPTPSGIGSKPCVAYSLYPGDGTCYLKKSAAHTEPNKGRISSILHPHPTPHPTPHPSPHPHPHPSPSPHPHPSPQPAPSTGVRVVYDAGCNPSVAAETAVQSDIVLLFGSTNSGEGFDRKTLHLDPVPYSSYPRFSANATQDFLIATVAKAVRERNPKAVVVVVMVVPGSVLTPWRDEVDAVISAFLPGQEWGSALASVLFGDEEPGGRLPITLPNTENDLGFTKSQWPGVPTPHTWQNGSKGGVVSRSTYSERLLTGYRGYGHHNITPAFPFGHGLGYTQWVFADLLADQHVVEFSVTNVGERSGETVAQLYLGFPERSGQPPKLLRRFRRVRARVNESVQVAFALDARALSVWDSQSHEWTLQTGQFKAYVGASSNDTKLITSFMVK